MKINLITGATGFVGKYLVNALLEKNEVVWVIVRQLDNVSSQKRAEKIFEGIISKWPKTFRIIDGDIMVEGLGIKDSMVNELNKNKVIFWHLAANLSFASENMANVQKTNYTGTVNVVEFVNKTSKKFIHMSTAYVCGNATSFKENDIFKGQKFRNHYESSKFKAEKYVRENCKLPFIIFRPSIIIGDAYQGKAEGCTFGYYRYTFMFYFLKKQIIKALQKNGIVASCLRVLGTNYNTENGMLKTPWLIIPYPKNGIVDMVTVDYVIASIIKLQDTNIHNRAIHITHNKPPAHRLLLNSIMHDMGFQDMRLLPVPIWMFRPLINCLYFIAVPIRKYIKSVMWYLPYVTKPCQFDRSTIEQYGENPPEISRELIERINSYAKENILEHIEI